MANYTTVSLTQAEVMKDISNLIVETGMNSTINMGGTSPFVELITKGTFTNGDGKLIRTTSLQDEHDYEEKKAAGRTKLTPDFPKIREQTIKAGARKFVEVTVEQYATAGAFESEGSLQSFVSELLSIPQKTKQAKIYALGLANLQAWNPTKNTQLEEIDLVDETTLTSQTQRAAAAASNAKNIYKKISMTLDDMEAPTTDFTDYAGFVSANPKDDFVVLLNSKFKADLDVDVIASLFNSDKLENLPRVITLPRRQLNSENQDTICWVIHKDKLQLFYRFIVATAMFDEFNLWTNHWLSYMTGIAIVLGLPGVKFKANYLKETPAP